MSSWEHLVGKTAAEATETVKADMPEADVQVVLDGSPVTRDFRFNRVRVFVDANDIVVSVPRTG